MLQILLYRCIRVTALVMEKQCCLMIRLSYPQLGSQAAEARLQYVPSQCEKIHSFSKTVHKYCEMNRGF